MQKLPDINPTDFVVDMDTGDADAVMKPLANLDKLVSILVLLVVVVGATVLYLVLTGRVKERAKESSILLSLGLSRKNIVCQYLAEVVFIAVFAFAFSIFTSAAVARTAGAKLLDYTAAQKEQEEEGFGTSIDGDTIVNSNDFVPVFERKERLTRIQVEIPKSGILLLLGAGFGIILLSVLAAGLPVLRMKPREILARIN